MATRRGFSLGVAYGEPQGIQTAGSRGVSSWERNPGSTGSSLRPLAPPDHPVAK